MSERGHEQHRPHHNPETHNHPEHLPPANSAEKVQAKHEHQENLDDIQKSIERHAKTTHESRSHHSPEASHGPSEAFATKELKIMAFNRTMSRIRRNLSPGQRTFSKAIHNPTIDKVSTALEQTVARPSAILGGGIIAAFGGFVYYFISRRFGYDYNATVVFVLFILGYLGGLLVDLVRKTSSPKF